MILAASFREQQLGGPWWKFGRGNNQENGNVGAGRSSSAVQESFTHEVLSAEHLVALFKNETTHDTVVIDFYGPNCPYCVQIAPLYERLAQEYHEFATFLKINAQRLPSLAEGVQGLPTFLFLCRAEPMGQLPGADAKALIETTHSAIKKCMEAKTTLEEAEKKLPELCPASEKFQHNVDFYGGTIEEGVSRVASKEACCGVCTIIPQCAGYTFKPGQDSSSESGSSQQQQQQQGTCYPKSAVANKVPTDPAMGIVSGTITDAQREEAVQALNAKAGGGQSGGQRSGARRPSLSQDLPSATCSFEKDVDFSSHDLPSGTIRRKDRQACCDYCAAADDCKGFTFMESTSAEDLEGYCFLKSSDVGRRDADPRMRITSGVVVTTSSPAGGAPVASGQNGAPAQSIGSEL